MTMTEQGGEGSGRIRVAFIMLAPTIWPSVRSVWEACRADPRFSVHLILAPSAFLNRQTREFIQARNFLIAEGLPFSHAYPGILGDLKPDVAFVPVPYMTMLPQGLREEDFAQHGVRIAYVPYGLEMGGGGFNMQYQFNLPLQNIAWRVFARSESHRRMFSRYCASGSAHVAVTGAPRMDRLARLDEIDATRLEAQIARRKAILWAPHFSEGGEAAWSSFGPYREHVLAQFEARPKTHALILRPHPLLFGNLRTKGYWTPQDEAAFRERIAAAGNIILDESADYLPAFKAADAIMADAGSFLLEFFATGKPVLYMAPEGGFGLNDDAHLLNHLQVCGGPDDVAAFIEAVGKGDDPMAEQRRAARATYLHMPETGTVGQAIADHIADAVLAGDDARTPYSGEAPAQAEARAFWAKAATSNIRSQAYYAAKDTILKGLLEAHGPFGTAVDIGSGEGRFTLTLAPHVRQVTACDTNKAFIDAARAKATEAGVQNVDWRVESLTQVETLGRYDLVSCCDVLANLVDVRSYALAVSLLRAMVKPGGLLLVEDALVAGATAIGKDPNNGYVGAYRNARDYEEAFVDEGFELIARSQIETRGSVEHTMFLFRRTGD